MSQQADHDMLTKLTRDVEYIRTTVDEIKTGKTEVCVVHKQRLNNHWTHIKAIWSVLSATALIVGGALVRHFWQ